MEDFLNLVQKAGIIGVLIFAVFQLTKIVKYLSTELKQEIKKNDEVLVELYEKRVQDQERRIIDIKEEFNTIIENESKTNTRSNQ